MPPLLAPIPPIFLFIFNYFLCTTITNAAMPLSILRIHNFHWHIFTFHVVPIQARGAFDHIVIVIWHAAGAIQFYNVTVLLMHPWSDRNCMITVVQRRWMTAYCTADQIMKYLHHEKTFLMLPKAVLMVDNISSQ